MKHALITILSMFTLIACTSTRDASSPIATETEKIPYPNNDLQQQIDRLSVEITRLQNRLDELEKNKTTPRAKPKTVPKPTFPIQKNTSASSHLIVTLYQQKQYQLIIQQLSQANNHHTINAQDMYYLIQSHYQLKQCQSVIDIARRYLVRFHTNPKAASVMHQIGWCQWKLQQKDIARDTWRQLIKTYPKSAAAQQAQIDLKQ